MPGYVIHLAIGKEYAKRNKIKDEESFFRGIIMPDLLDKKTSHYGDASSNPDLAEFLNTNALDTEYNKYRDISRRVHQLYNNYSDKQPHETNAMNKMMTWYGIQMRTMMDDTTSKLSELLMQGTNMGIIEGRRLINQNENAADDVKGILHDFVVMQEDSVETLKKYL